MSEEKAMFEDTQEVDSNITNTETVEPSVVSSEEETKDIAIKTAESTNTNKKKKKRTAKRREKNNEVKMTTTTEKKSERILSIDRFRGLCMFLMVCSFIFPLFSCFDFLAPIVEHGDGGFQVLPGISFADLFAAMFIFVIGLTIVKSFKSREAKFGTRKAYWQLATRFLALIGIGILFNGFENGWVDIFLGDKTFADLSIQIKIYAIGFWIAIALLIMYVVSRFVKNDKFKVVSENLFRYFLAVAGILALYFILVATAEKITVPVNGNRYGGWEWDTLQNIGLAGLMALPFIRFDKWGRLIMVGITFTVLTILMQNGLFPLAKSILEGGIFGGFSWACILLMGSVFAEFKDDNKKYWILSSLILLISVVLIVSFNFTAAKRGCTPVYAMFCIAIASMIWGGLNTINNWKPKFDFFAIWGSNAILTYISTIFVIGMLLGGLLGAQLVGLSIWAAIPIILVFLAAFTVMNWLLRRYNKYIRI